MPDYVFYDENGKIVKKKSSISSHLVDEGLIDGYERALKVDRATYNSLTRWHKVENGKIVEMTQAEKDIILQAEQNAKDQRKQFVDGIKAKFKAQGFDDEEIDFILNTGM